MLKRRSAVSSRCFPESRIEIESYDLYARSDGMTVATRSAFQVMLDGETLQVIMEEGNCFQAVLVCLCESLIVAK